MPADCDPLTVPLVNPDLTVAMDVLADVIDRNPDPDDAAFRAAQALFIAYDLEGLLFDPADDDYIGHARRHLAEARRLLRLEREVWNQQQAAGGGALAYDDLGDDLPA